MIERTTSAPCDVCATRARDERVENKLRGLDKIGSSVGWAGVLNRISTVETYYQCPKCGALWCKLDDTDPGARASYLFNLRGVKA